MFEKAKMYVYQSAQALGVDTKTTISISILQGEEGVYKTLSR